MNLKTSTQRILVFLPNRPSIYENSIRASIRERERICRECGIDLDTPTVADTKINKFIDGRRRIETFAFCSVDHKEAYDRGTR